MFVSACKFKRNEAKDDWESGIAIGSDCETIVTIIDAGFGIVPGQVWDFRLAFEKGCLNLDNISTLAL